MNGQHSRRNWLQMAGSAVAGAYLAGKMPLRAAAPATRVTVAKCQAYDPGVLVATLDRMFDQLGGLGRMVKDKTVAIKINLTGAPTYRLGYLPAEDTHYTHPHVIAATVHLMGKAGARRIRLLESPWSTADPIEEVLLGQLGAARHSQRRAERGVREYQLSRASQPVRAHDGAAGRAGVSRLRAESLLPRL